MVSVQAPAGATCSIAYRTPAGTASTAAGLGEQTVPSTGVVTWTFMIGSSTQPGIGSISVTCGNATINTTLQIGSGGLSR
jgi:micrococcal nuclease